MKNPATRTIIIALIIYLLMIIGYAKDLDAAPVQTNKDLPCQEWHSLLRKNHLPVKVFAPIMFRESRCLANAVGWNYQQGFSHSDCVMSPAKTYRKCKRIRSYDVGLLQINSDWRSLTYRICNTKEILTLRNPACNLAVASVLYDKGSGLGNWRATSSGNIRTK